MTVTPFKIKTPGYDRPEGKFDFGEVEGAEEVAALTSKVDAIKAMLDSTVYGLQKMSSNLDDIMVKLDV